MAHRSSKNNSTAICLLGHGPFADVAFSHIRDRFTIVDLKKADIAVVCNYGKILGKDELALPPCGMLNIHPSLLPLHRGASPIQSAIAHGDTQTGVTIIQMDEKIDHGPICAQKVRSIKPDDTFQTLSDTLARIAAPLIVKTIDLRIAGTLSPHNQDHAHATYTQKITHPIYIDQYEDDNHLYNTIRAYAHEPGVFITLEKSNLKILQARLVRGKLRLTIVQRPGKKAMSYDEFARGYNGVLPFALI